MSLDIFNFSQLHMLGSDDDLNQVTGTSADDTLVGTAGSDRITGVNGDDMLSDSAGGDDILSGGAGDDIITISRTAASTDKIRAYGGVGADTITYTGEVGSGVILSIDAGSGANIINVSHANHATIMGGNAVDTVTVSTDGYALVHTAEGDDVITASADNADARVGISTGGGNDSITLESDNDGHYRMRLGEGQDSVHQNASTDDSTVKLVFYDFQAGADGDTLDMMDYLHSVLTGAHKDLFADGHLRLSDSTTPDGRECALLEMDIDGKKGPADWVKLAVFVGVDAADLTSDNLLGLDPTVTTSSDFAV